MPILNKQTLVIDTTLEVAEGSFLELRRKDTKGFRTAVDRGLVVHPTKQAVRDLVEEFDHSLSVLEPLFRNEEGELEWMGRGFRTGRRKAFVRANKTEYSHLPADVEPK